MKVKTLFKSLLFFLLIFAIAVPAEASERGEKTFGVRTGYVSRNRSMDVGLFFQYTFSQHFRLQPAADLIFRNRDRDAFTFDINALFPITKSTEKYSIYPLAGINFSSWNRQEEILDTTGPIEVSSRTNKFGVNLGAGFDLKVSETLKITLDATYTFVAANSGVRILAGIGYVF